MHRFLKKIWKIFSQYTQADDSKLSSVAPERLVIVLVGTVGLFSVLWWRLWEVQIFRGDFFLELADENRYHVQLLPAERGIITDHLGKPLVVNQTTYFLREKPNALYSELTPISHESALFLSATNPAAVERNFIRTYVYPEALAHLVGYVGPVSETDLENRPELSIHHSVGKLGLEAAYDARLQGKDGRALWETNALGQRVRLVRRDAEVPGNTVTTTLDAELSQFAWQSLQSKVGAIVVSDASSGAILASVSTPGFNPNIFALKDQSKDALQVRASTISAALNDPRKLFFNRAFSGTYPPGSIFKVVTALAGLESGAFDASTSVVDEGILRVGEYEYRNWYYTQYGRTEGTIQLVRALARSNDIYFYKAAEWIGPDTLANFARKLGLGVAPKIETGLSASGGRVPDPRWKEQVLHEQWYLGNTYHMGIGQGDILVSPLQIAQLGQVLSNRGLFCRPHLIPGPSECVDLGVHQEDLDLVLQGMIEACSPGGTAFPFFPRNQVRYLPSVGIEENLAQGAMACKTGTAEFGAADPVTNHRKTHGWLLAIGEPKYASGSAQSSLPKRLIISALVESDETQPYKEGSRDAGPVVKQIWDWLEGVSTSSGQVNTQTASPKPEAPTPEALAE